MPRVALYWFETRLKCELGVWSGGLKSELFVDVADKSQPMSLREEDTEARDLLRREKARAKDRLPQDRCFEFAVPWKGLARQVQVVTGRLWGPTDLFCSGSRLPTTVSDPSNMWSWIRLYTKSICDLLLTRSVAM